MNHALMNKMGVLLAPASQTAAATRSATLDVRGADFATIKVNLAAEVNTSAVGPTIEISESDGTTYATWSSDFSVTTEDLANAHQKIFHIDLRGRKKTLKLAITAKTHTTNDIVTASADYILSRREFVPAGTAGMIGSTNDSVVVG